MSELEYTIQRSAEGYVVSGPALLRPTSAFTSKGEALSLVRHLIAAKSGGGYIIGPDGERSFYRGSRHLYQDGAIQR